jgi:hypothetical protein
MSTSQYSSCMQACCACIISCEVCASSCFKEDVITMTTCIQLNRDCADMCRLTEVMMARESGLIDELCRLCAIICQACADECRKYQHDYCQQCAKACKRCTEECNAVFLA